MYYIDIEIKTPICVIFGAIDVFDIIISKVFAFAATQAYCVGFEKRAIVKRFYFEKQLLPVHIKVFEHSQIII